MSQRIEREFLKQVEKIREQTEGTGLPFADLLDADQIDVILSELGVEFRERVYTPDVVVGMFLFQAISDDASCRNAVSKLIAQRIAEQRAPCSPNTGSYSTARARLPEELLRRLARQIGQRLAGRARGGLAGRAEESLAVAGACGQGGRRHDGQHARQRRKPTGISAARRAAARPRFSDRTVGGGLLAGGGDRAGHGDRSLSRQANRRKRLVPQRVVATA